MEFIPITLDTLSPVSAKIDGEWLELAIPRDFYDQYGIRCYFLTSSVSGRENDTVNVNSSDLPFDGSVYHGKRRPSRTLTITFYIESDTRNNVNLAYEFLIGRLNTKKEVKLLFADELNKYYSGIYAGASYSGYGYNGKSVGIIGNFQFFCADPHKYSTTLKEFAGSYDSSTNVLSLQVQNKGSIPVAIDYDVTFNQNSGYIGFVSDDGAMQFGDSEETATTGSRNLVTYTGQSLVNAINDASITGVHDLSTIPDSSDANYYFSEHFSTKDGVFTIDPTDNKYLTIDKNSLSKSINTGLSRYGAGVVIDINKTDVPVRNYEVELQPWFETFKDQAQKGLFQVFVVHKPASGRATVISGLQMQKSDAANNIAKFYFKVGNDGNKGGKDLYIGTWTPNYSSMLIENGPSVNFSKSGSTFTFKFGNTVKSFSDSYYGPGGAGENLAATHLVIFIGNMRGYNKWVGRYPISGDENSQYPRMRLGKIKMDQNDPITTTFTADNTYKAGDKMLINGNDATVSVNGMNRVGDEKIGTEYFEAKPGTNNIQVLFSNFTANNPPTVKAKIREGWL